MVPDAIRKQAEAVVVGSGPGGATVARQLARGGTKVVLLERGGDHRRKAYYGTYLGPLTYADRHSLLFTKEGLNTTPWHTPQRHRAFRPDAR